MSETPERTISLDATISSQLEPLETHTALLRIPISLGANTINALIDTGASVSLLCLQTFEQLNPKIVKLLKGPNEITSRFRSVSGNVMRAIGLYNIRMTLQNTHSITHPFFVINQLDESCILGIDFITKHELIVHPKTRTMRYSHMGEPCYMKIPPFRVFSVAIEDPLKPRNDDLSPAQGAILENLLKQHSSLFAGNLSELRAVVGVMHEINTTGSPVFQRMRRVPNSLKPTVKAKIDEMLAHGIIKESSSPYASPIVIVPKKNGEIRICVDYRQLNAVTIKDRFPLPRVDDTIDTLFGARYFTSLDFFSGYHQVLVKPEDQHKTAFICEFGLFEYIRMSFGLTNAPATFQRAMNNIFRDVLYKFALCYLDDLIIYSKTFEEHIQHLEIIFEIIKKSGLRLNMSKCQFVKMFLEYLGHIVSRDGVSPCPKKIQAIVEFPAPTNVKEVQSFLGGANYYRKYVRAFAEKAHSLTQLTRKDAKWKWGDEEQRAFDSIKNSLISQPILRYPDFGRDFLVHTDASSFGIGAVLCQMQDPSHSGNDQEVVIAYSSKHLIDRELKWSTTEKEAYAIIHAVTAFRPYLYGRRFKVVTDHRALEWLMSKKEPAGRLARWALKLQEYQISIEYRPGKKHQNADCLSRTPVQHIHAVFSGYDDWISAQQRDEFCSSILKKLTRNSHKERKITFQLMSNGLLGTQTGLVVVPSSLQKGILELNHDHMTAGHLGISKTLARIQERYYWRHLIHDVTAHVNSCLTCAKQKVKGSSKAPLQSMPVPELIWETLAMDILGPVTESTNGNRYILVISDYATRYVIACPMPDQTAKTVATAFVKEVLLKYGGPGKVLTDQGRQFTSGLYAEVCKLFNIKQLRTTAYHPQTDGLVERFNRTMKDLLTSFVYDKPHQWDTCLPFVVFAYNVSVHASTKHSPFYLLFGRDPSLATDLTPPSKVRTVGEDGDALAQHWVQALDLAKNNIKKAQAVQKRNYDQGSSLVAYNVLDKVLLKSPPTAGKFNQVWEGPFTITKLYGPFTFAICNDETQKVTIVHSNRLKLFKTADVKPIIEKTEDRELEVVSPTAIPKRKPGRPKGSGTAMAMPSKTENRPEQRATSISVKTTTNRGRPRMTRMHGRKTGQSAELASSEFSSSMDSLESEYVAQPRVPTQTRYNLRRRT